jgi:GNAT superfamily N-acetyltransferase
MAIEIRLLAESENELANKFFNEVYRTNRTIENFQWEFIQGPRGKAIYVVAIDTLEKSFVKIVGIQCAIPLELMSVDGRYILTAKSEDTLVHPGYRGQKLFEKMYDLLFEECKKAGIKYIWGFTPALKAFERLGFEAPFKTTQALLVFKPIKAFRHLKNLNPANKFLDEFKIFVLMIVSCIVGLKRLFIKTASMPLEEVIPSSKEDIVKTFYAQKSNLYFLRMNDAYLNWRLLKNPFGNTYKNFRNENPKVPAADILINVRAELSYIEQMLFSSTVNSSERLHLVKSALNKLEKTGTPAVRVLCFNNNVEMMNQIRLLKKAGFLHLERGNYFVWKPLDESRLISPGDIFFSRLFTQGNV